jgi:hypothetical protein
LAAGAWFVAPNEWLPFKGPEAHYLAKTDFSQNFQRINEMINILNDRDLW